MQKTQIAFFDAKPYDIESFDQANAEYGFEIRYIPSRLNEETAALTAGATVVCAFVSDVLSAGVLDRLAAQGVQLIALRCAGYNNLDFKAAHGRLHVVRVPSYSPYAVAEHSMALILALNRKTHKAYYRTRDNNFTINGLLGFDLHGKTAGVIGTGKIGLVLAGILRGFGMKVLAYDKFPNQAAQAELGFSYVDLDTLCRASDVISLHCPLTKETTHMIDEARIAQMKDGVYIINTSRGRLIDTNALIQGLKSKKVGAAGLDVYEEEGEYFFEDFSGENIEDDVLARLLTFNNVLVTSHQGFFTREAMHNISRTTLQNVRDFLSTGRCENEICYQCVSGKDACKRKSSGQCF